MGFYVPNFHIEIAALSPRHDWAVLSNWQGGPDSNEPPESIFTKG